MDEIEGGPLALIPPAALGLTLTRATIRMQHSETWSIDKVNLVDDLVICLEGRGDYVVGEERLKLEAGEAMLIPQRTRFFGQTPGPDLYIGVAQHFRVDLFGTDLIRQLVLRPKVRLSRWDVLGPLVRLFRQTAPPSSVTLAQHHTFMVLLLAYLEDAFLDWRGPAAFRPDGAAALDLAVTVAASRIAANPLDDAVAARSVADVPYNPDYFLRAFRQRIGRTPRQFREFKRMERAMHLLEMGQTVAVAGAEVGFSDPYYFSRQFKAVTGLSPRGYVARVRQSRHGAHMARDETDRPDAFPEFGLGAGAKPSGWI